MTINNWNETRNESEGLQVTLLRGVKLCTVIIISHFLSAGLHHLECTTGRPIDFSIHSNGTNSNMAIPINFVSYVHVIFTVRSHAALLTEIVPSYNMPWTQC